MYAYRLTFWATGVRDSYLLYVYRSALLIGRYHICLYLTLGWASYTTCTTRSGLVYAVIFTPFVPRY